MKLLLVTGELVYGGAQRQLLLLARGLRRRGWPVAVAVYKPGQFGLAELAAEGIPVHRLKLAFRFDMAGLALGLIRLIRRERFAAAYGFLPVENLALALARPFLPPVSLFFGIRASDIPAGHYGRLARLAYALEPWTARAADRLIANAEAGKRVVAAKGVDAARIAVIPNAVDTARFAPDPDGGRRLRAAWGVPAEAPLIGLVARLDPMKDHATFIEAAARLHAERPEVRFVCVGDGPPAYAAALREMAARRGLTARLTWAGAVETMPAAYGALTLATLTSAFGEGWPNVLGEAMACGVLFVATDVGDAAAILGPLGHVVPPRDPAALARAWSLALDRREAAADGLPGALRARIEAAFGIDALVARTACLISGAEPRA